MFWIDIITSFIGCFLAFILGAAVVALFVNARVPRQPAQPREILRDVTRRRADERPDMLDPKFSVNSPGIDMLSEDYDLSVSGPPPPRKRVQRG